MDFSHLANVPIIDGHIHHGPAREAPGGGGKQQSKQSPSLNLMPVGRHEACPYGNHPSRLSCLDLWMNQMESA